VKGMNNANSLAETIMKKQELAEREEELTKKAMEDSINARLKRYFEEVPNDKFLEALRDKRYLYVCLKVPKFENKNTWIGKMYIESFNEVLRQQNENNSESLLEIETDRFVIKNIIRSKRNKDCVGNLMNTVLIHIIGKETVEKSAK